MKREPGVGERRWRRRPLTAEQVEQSFARPAVACEGIERLVVEHGEHLDGGCHRLGPVGLRRRRHRGPPDLLRPRLHPPCKTLPADGQFFIAPGHLDCPRLGVQPAIANHPGSQREAATMTLLDRQADRPLRAAGLAPSSREQDAVLQHLNQHPPRVVARADNRLEGLSRLHRPGRPCEGKASPHRIAVGRRIDHLDQPRGLHCRRVCSGGNRKRCPVDARLQGHAGHGLAGGRIGRGVG